MTTQEFSDNFDTFLSSYLHTQEFGEQSSQADVALDEYEKSLFLTQAQDIIVKSYFEAQNNANGKGIDDSTERQIDFSSLISYRKITRNDVNGVTHEYQASGTSGQAILRGTVLNEYFTTLSDATIEYWAEQPMIIFYNDSSLLFDPEGLGKLTLTIISTYSEEDLLEKVYVEYKGRRVVGKPQTNTKLYAADIRRLSTGSQNIYELVFDITSLSAGYINILDQDESQPNGLIKVQYHIGKVSADTFTGTDIAVNLASLNCLFILNERIIDLNDKSYVVVPLNYKEYDRMSSRAYDEPLKRQAWRLFNADENTVGMGTEIIMRSDAAGFKEYRVRYVRRPKPIILVDLSDTNNNLNIDGYTAVTECELNPILHNEILQTAVQLALTARGRVSQPSNNKEERRE